MQRLPGGPPATPSRALFRCCSVLILDAAARPPDATASPAGAAAPPVAGPLLQTAAGAGAGAGAGLQGVAEAVEAAASWDRKVHQLHLEQLRLMVGAGGGRRAGNF